MLLVDDLAAGGTKNLRHTPRGLVTLIILKANLSYTESNAFAWAYWVSAVEYMYETKKVRSSSVNVCKKLTLYILKLSSRLG